MAKRPFSLIFVALLSAMIGAIFYFAYQQWAGEPARVRRVVDPPALLREIQGLNELVSVKYTLQKVIGLEEQKVPVGSEKILLFVQAEVLAGVDMSALRPEDVSIKSEQQALIRLPEPKVLHVVLDEEETKVWDRQITWWTPWVPYSPDLERQARLSAREAIEDAAIQMGILDEARRNAESSIRALLEVLGFKTVVFNPVS